MRHLACQRRKQSHCAVVSLQNTWPYYRDRKRTHVRPAQNLKSTHFGYPISAVHWDQTKLDEACGGRPPRPGMTALRRVGLVLIRRLRYTHTTITVTNNPAKMRKIPTVLRYGIARLKKQTVRHPIQVTIYCCLEKAAGREEDASGVTR